jgi:hypothetical protein
VSKAFSEQAKKAQSEKIALEQCLTEQTEKTNIEKAERKQHEKKIEQMQRKIESRQNATTVIPAKSSYSTWDVLSRVGALAPALFFERGRSKEKQLYQQTLAEYEAVANQQIKETQAVRECLARYLEENEVRNNELLQTQEIQQVTLIREFLDSYPTLPESGQLCVTEIRAVLESRFEHHAGLMTLASQFIPGSFFRFNKD